MANQLDLETFKTVIGADFEKLKGKFDVANFERVLDQKNFDHDIVRREVLKNKLMEDGFFRGHEPSKQNDIMQVLSKQISEMNLSDRAYRTQVLRKRIQDIRQKYANRLVAEDVTTEDDDKIAMYRTQKGNLVKHIYDEEVDAIQTIYHDPNDLPYRWRWSCCGSQQRYHKRH